MTVIVPREGLEFRRSVMNERDMARTIRRLGHQMIEGCRDLEIFLIGVRTRGVPLAQRLKRVIQDAGRGTTGERIRHSPLSR